MLYVPAVHKMLLISTYYTMTGNCVGSVYGLLAVYRM